MWVLAITAIIIALIIYSRLAKKALIKKLAQEGYDVANRIEHIRFISGHPDIDSNLPVTGLFRRGDFLYIMKTTYALRLTYEFVGSIPLNDIVNIDVLDDSYSATSYANGQEASQLAVTWQDGRFQHNSIFGYRGNNAINKATKARNILLRIIQQPA